MHWGDGGRPHVTGRDDLQTMSGPAQASKIMTVSLSIFDVVPTHM